MRSAEVWLTLRLLFCRDIAVQIARHIVHPCHVCHQRCFAAIVQGPLRFCSAPCYRFF